MIDAEGYVERTRTLESGERLVTLSFLRSAPNRGVRLTPAQAQVRDAVLAGLSTARIATQRGASQRTVNAQIAKVFQAYRVNSRAELAAVCEGITTSHLSTNAGQAR